MTRSAEDPSGKSAFKGAADKAADSGEYDEKDTAKNEHWTLTHLPQPSSNRTTTFEDE